MSSMQDTRHRQAQGIAWVGVVLNLLLMIGKAVVGVWAGSRALVADAVHSAADLVGSIAVIVGLAIARKPPDEDHPYGHGKAELISSGLVAGLLLAAAFDVAYSGVKSFFAPPSHPAPVAAYAAAAAIVVKEILYQFNHRIGRRLNSRSLMASAADHRSDVFSSMAALAGIGLSLLGVRLGWAWLLRMDAVAGIAVAVLVLKMGLDIAKDSVGLLMDRVVEEAHLGPYQEVIAAVPGVQHTDELRVRDHGQYLMVDVKVSVDANITVAAGHDIAVQVKQQLMQVFPRIQDVLVHVNPSYPEELLGGDGHG